MVRNLLLLSIISINIFSLEVNNLINESIKNSNLYKIESNKLIIQKNNLSILKGSYLPKSFYLNTNIYGSFKTDGVFYSVGPKLSYELFNSQKRYSANISHLEIELLKIDRTNKLNELFQYYYLLVSNIIYNQKLYHLSKEELKTREEHNKNIEARFNSKELSITEYTYSMSSILIYREEEKESKVNLQDSIVLFESETGIKIDDYSNIYIDLDSYDHNKESNGKRFNILKEITEFNLSEKINFRVDINTGLSYPFDSNFWNVGFNFYIDFPNTKKEINTNKLKALDNIKYEYESLINLNNNKLKNINKHIKNNLSKLKVYEESIKLLEKSLVGIIIESRNGEATTFDVILFQNRILDLKKEVIRIEYEIAQLKLENIYLKGGFILNE